MEKETIRYLFGFGGILCMAGTYVTYMTIGPGGDGAIFGTVIAGIGAVIGGIAGFEYGIKKSQD